MHLKLEYWILELETWFKFLFHSYVGYETESTKEEQDKQTNK